MISAQVPFWDMTGTYAGIVIEYEKYSNTVLE